MHGTRLADCFARNIAILISRSTVVDTYAASRIILVKSRKCAELFAPDLSVGFRRHQAVGPPLVLAGPPGSVPAMKQSMRHKQLWKTSQERRADCRCIVAKGGIFSHLCQGHIWWNQISSKFMVFLRDFSLIIVQFLGWQYNDPCMLAKF